MIDIQVGYIVQDIIALCGDSEAHYAIHSRRLKDGTYDTKVSSSHGVISNGVFEAGVGTRQMIYYALAKHLETVEAAFEEAKKKKDSGEVQPNRQLN
jgi:hypothetical protein